MCNTGGGGNDVFTYTIRDADGSLSHATLTVLLGDSAPSNIIIPPANTPGQTQVFEAGLGPRGVEPAGSHAGDSSFPVTTSGTITFISPDGVSKIELGGADGSYSYVHTGGGGNDVGAHGRQPVGDVH